MDKGKYSEELEASRNLVKTTIDASMDMIQVFEAIRNEQNEIVDFRYVLLNQEAERDLLFFKEKD